MKNILVPPTGNCCRSHMPGNKANVCSAGIEIHGVNPRAVSIMKEVGVDVSLTGVREMIKTHCRNFVHEYFT